MKHLILVGILGVTAFACSKTESNSEVKLVDSDDMVLALESGIFAESASVAEAKARVTVDKTGLLKYSIDADMTIADITSLTLFNFERKLKLNPKFVNFATYKDMKLGLPVAYQERGETLASITKLSEKDQSINLIISHLATGLSANVVITEGLHGLANIEEVQIDGSARVRATDPMGRIDRIVEESPYWPYYTETNVPKKLMGVLEGALKVKRVR